MHKGTSKLWIAEITGRILTAAAAVYTARVIGVESYGLVGYVAAVSSYFSVFVRFGTDFILVRELSRDVLKSPDEKNAFRAVVIFLRLIFALCSAIVMIYIGINAESELLSKLYFANAFALTALLLPLDVLLQSEEKFGTVAVSRVFFNACNLFFIFVFLNDSSIAWWIPLASGLSMIVTQLFFFQRVQGKIIVPSVVQFKHLSIFLFKESTPVLLSMLLLLMVGQLGIILVKHFASAYELGLYVTGYKIYDIANAMLVPVSTTLFPQLSKIWSGSTKAVRTTTLLEGIKIALPISLLAVGVSLLCGKELLALFFGERFSGSDVYMSILLMTLAFRSISMFFANALVAGGKQNLHFVVTALMVFINLILSYVIIKNYGAYGAAWSNLIAFAIELIGFTVVIWKQVDGREIFATVFMSILVWMFAYGIGFLTTTAIRIEIYSSFIGSAAFVIIFMGIVFRFRTYLNDKRI
ncbi:MAG: oligosaccharide flippase family protein [Bacteroidota bacterium]|nr:oligosaccharide flippase family protein [Bacteroidota bacterium]